MKYVFGKMLILNILICGTTYAMEPWTWLFKRDFAAHQLQKLKDQKNLLFSKIGTPLFSQLIFSWNAFRPECGHFSFWVCARDAVTKKWHDWHKMIEWGNGIQRTYFNTSDSGTKYCHVRLEMPSSQLADGLKIKIEAQDGASLALLKSIAVNIINMQKFIAEPLDVTQNLPSIIVEGVPIYSQMVLDHPKASVMCSPTSTSMLVSYLRSQNIYPVDFADCVYDPGLDSYGSWPFNNAHAFEQCGGAVLFRVVRLHSFVDLYKKMQEKIPVVVSVRGKLRGAPQDYNNGHLLLVVGWDQKKKKVLCHDPAFPTLESVYAEYDIDAFCAAWECSRRLAYVAEITTK